jgi:hypothetical protein
MFGEWWIAKDIIGQAVRAVTACQQGVYGGKDLTYLYMEIYSRYYGRVE